MDFRNRVPNIFKALKLCEMFGQDMEFYELPDQILDDLE